MGIVEGKAGPYWNIAKLHTKLGNMVGLVLLLTKHLIKNGSLVVMESGFCVLKAIIELKKVSNFISDIIKERRCWHKYVKGEDIKDRFK